MTKVISSISQKINTLQNVRPGDKYVTREEKNALKYCLNGGFKS